MEMHQNSSGRAEAGFLSQGRVLRTALAVLLAIIVGTFLRLHHSSQIDRTGPEQKKEHFVRLIDRIWQLGRGCAAIRRYIQWGVWDEREVIVLPLRKEEAGSDERTEALIELRRLRDKAAWAVPVLIEALNKADDEEYGIKLAKTLAAIGPAAAPAVPALGEFGRRISDDPCDYEYYAVLPAVLGAIGTASRDTIPLLVDLVSYNGADEWDPIDIFRPAYSPTDRYKHFVRELTVKKYLAGVEEGRNVVRREERNRRVQLAAIRVLGEIGPAARDALPALKAYRDSPRDEERRAAEEAILEPLRAMGPTCMVAVGAAGPVLDGLRAPLRDEEQRVVEEAIREIEKTDDGTVASQSAGSNSGDR